MTKFLSFLFCFVALALQSAFCQLPSTDIYLFRFAKSSDKSFVFSEPKLLTNFNDGGYNNQPAFFGNQLLFLTVQSKRDTTQTEIVGLNLSKRLKTNITASNDSEYSPTLMPDSKRFSCIRVEEKSGYQRLWSFPKDPLMEEKFY